MFWLSLIGLGITVAGGIFAAIGQAQQNKADQAAIHEQQKVYDAQQAALKAQLEYINNQKQSAEELAQINVDQIRQTAAYSGLQVSEAGAKAKGSSVATAAVGNVSGQSVLRQTQDIQMKVDRQTGVLSSQANADIKTQNIQLKSTLEGLDVSSLETQASLLQSEVTQTNSLADAEFLQKYGWLSVVATALGAGAAATNQASSADWSMPEVTSLATENYNYDWKNYQYDYRQWGDF
jgi:hypothetical protein